MLQSLQALVPGQAWSLLIVVPCLVVSFGIIERLVVNYRLSKVNGVRASNLAGNPVTGMKRDASTLCDPRNGQHYRH